jgi:hypothetical protein
MAESARDHDSTNSFRLAPNKRIAQSLTAISAIAFGVISVTFIFQRFLHREFLGEGTRLVQLCKRDPQANPRACQGILSSRIEVSNKRAQSLSGTLESARFNLSNTQDADLIPPPDLVR